MKILSRHTLLTRISGLIALLTASVVFLGLAPAPAQADSPSPDERPFSLPFAQPSGPETWLMAQPYGNTTGAYYRRYSLYGASGGIHFGVDLSAPCGTEIVAIADGVVFAVDGPFGSAPHNLMIDHPQLGYASMYGHLLEAPALFPGQKVEQGQVIARVGDSEGKCYRRPHLHLEIRDLGHIQKYNPATLVQADWDGLALIGSSGRSFMRDLAEPRKWQSLYDQPQARTWGPIINDFEETWPFDWSKRDPEEKTAVEFVTSVGAEIDEFSPEAVKYSAEALKSSAIGRQITSGNCCTRPFWSQESSQVQFVDQPGPNAPLGVWGVDVTGKEPASPELVSERLGIYSPDGRLIAYPDRDKGVAVVERLEDGQRWEIDIQERAISFTPDSQGLIWTAYNEDAPSDSRPETIYLAEVDGSGARAVYSAVRTDPIAWLSKDKLLMERGFAGTSDIELFTLSLKDGSEKVLMAGPRMRGLAFSPDQRHLLYYVTFEADAEKNGVWLLDLEEETPKPQKLPFFGTYRWRDNQRLIYVPYEPDAATHNFYEYHILTGRTRSLFPEGTGLKIANNDWQVSPDGRKIALVAAKGQQLDGIWVIDLDDGQYSRTLERNLRP